MPNIYDLFPFFQHTNWNIETPHLYRWGSSDQAVDLTSFQDLRSPKTCGNLMLMVNVHHGSSHPWLMKETWGLTPQSTSGRDLFNHIAPKWPKIIDLFQNKVHSVHSNKLTLAGWKIQYFDRCISYWKRVDIPLLLLMVQKSHTTTWDV